MPSNSGNGFLVLGESEVDVRYHLNVEVDVTYSWTMGPREQRHEDLQTITGSLLGLSAQDLDPWLGKELKLIDESRQHCLLLTLDEGGTFQTTGWKKIDS